MTPVEGRKNFRQCVAEYFELTLDTLYPIRFCRKGGGTPGGIEALQTELRELLDANVDPYEGDVDALIDTWPKRLEATKIELGKDIEAIYEGDPACESRNEIIIAYPGFYAVAAYRLAHELLLADVPLIPRVMTEYAHSVSGVDIHPGAKIGSHLCIDHGTGVVIGQTADIGNHVKIYQGVTLGALSVDGRASNGKRHPTIQDDVIIYAQATILGGDTVVGEGSIIGGNVWLTESVAPHTKLYYRPPEAEPCN